MYPAIDTTALRAALARYATGVTIVTCLDAAGERMGLTANSFSALSLEPALVLWSLRRSSASLPAFESASHFAINVLAEEQLELSRRFSGRADDKFAAGDWREGWGGAPVLAGSAAVFECANDTRHVAGDHLLFIGRVLACQASASAPLVYQASHYHALGSRL